MFYYVIKKKLVGKLRIICFITWLSKENKDLNSKKHKKSELTKMNERDNEDGADEKNLIANNFITHRNRTLMNKL
jgi:hypothetical protein